MTDYLTIARSAVHLEPENAPAWTEPCQAELEHAVSVLNRAGFRIVELEDGTTAHGIWSDLDGPVVRAALRALGSDLPVRYLDGAGIPSRYKVRRVAGEPVPLNVLAAMERNPEEPWTIRDRMLTGMGWQGKGIPFETWRDQQLFAKPIEPLSAEARREFEQRHPVATTRDRYGLKGAIPYRNNLPRPGPAKADGTTRVAAIETRVAERVKEAETKL